MLSNNSFNLEVIPSIKSVLPELEALPEKIRRGTTNFEEVAKFTGSPKLQATAANQLEASENLIKSIGEVVEACEKYVQHYQALEDVL